MNVCRAGYALALIAFVGFPLLAPFHGVLDRAAWNWTTDDRDRLVHLSLNTFGLTAATLTLSLPIGLCLAVLLFRTSLCARRFFLVLLALALFVPLPVLVSSWQDRKSTRLNSSHLG